MCVVDNKQGNGIAEKEGRKGNKKTEKRKKKRRRGEGVADEGKEGASIFPYRQILVYRRGATDANQRHWTGSFGHLRIEAAASQNWKEGSLFQ